MSHDALADVAHSVQWRRPLRRAVARAAQELGYRLGDVLSFVGLPVPAPLSRPAPLLPSDVYEMRALLRRRGGCPICRRVDQDVRHMVFWFVVESYGEGAWIERLTESGGFCPAHFWLVARTGARYQLSYVVHYLAEHDLRRLRRLAHRVARAPDSLASALRALDRSLPCPCCQTEADSARRGVQVLLRALADDQVRALWRRSDGLCWPHLQLAVAWPTRAALAEVLDVERERMERLLVDACDGSDTRIAQFLSGSRVG